MTRPFLSYVIDASLSTQHTQGQQEGYKDLLVNDFSALMLIMSSLPEVNKGACSSQTTLFIIYSPLELVIFY